MSDTVTAAIIGGAALVVASYVAARSGGRKGAAKGAEEAVAPVKEELSTGNDKRLGEYVHDMAGTLEVVQIQGRMNAREIEKAKELAASAVVKADEMHAEVMGALSDTASRLDEHLEQAAPMADWVKEQMEQQQQKEEL